MSNIRVKIYERVKVESGWTALPVGTPKLRKEDGKPFLHDDRQGKFRISWYENRRKQWQTVKNCMSDEELPYLSEAVAQAEDKAWFLNNRHRNVADPTAKTAVREELAEKIASYLDAKSGSKKTVSVHRLALTEFQAWATQQKRDVASGMWMRSRNRYSGVVSTT